MSDPERSEESPYGSPDLAKDFSRSQKRSARAKLLLGLGVGVLSLAGASLFAAIIATLVSLRDEYGGVNIGAAFLLAIALVLIGIGCWLISASNRSPRRGRN